MYIQHVGGMAYNHKALSRFRLMLGIIDGENEMNRASGHLCAHIG